MIDDFNGGDDTVVSGFFPGPSNTAYAGAIGGSRTLEATSGAAGATLLSVAAGILIHGQGPVGGGTSLVVWDAAGAGLGGIDLTDGGSDDGLSIDILGIDSGLVNLEFTITDTSAMSSSLLLIGLGVGTQGFLFTDFVGTADFTDADYISLEITALAGSDLTLDFVETAPVSVALVPEPATLSLLGLGVFALCRRRSRPGRSLQPP
ncbi:MAG: PEP-CTERM sorting domain-containing protein [Planctomycetales bacterium]|nr:PEP-CTERM sorting domain-containing protein [Planctomycetales bacterium]